MPPELYMYYIHTQTYVCTRLHSRLLNDLYAEHTRVWVGGTGLAGTGSLEAAAQREGQNGCVSGEVSRAGGRGGGGRGCAWTGGRSEGLVRAVWCRLQGPGKLDRAFRLQYSKKKALFHWVFFLLSLEEK